MNTSPVAIRIAIIEDHLLQRRRTEYLLATQKDFRIVFSGASAPDFVQWANQLPSSALPQLIILDLVVDRQPSVEISLVRSWLNSGIQVVVLSALSSPALVRQIVQAGVQAILTKSDSEEDILSAIRATLAGGKWTTPEVAQVIAGDPDRPQLSIQEENALILYASGLPLKDVAASMNIKESTAKQYVDRVKAKYVEAGITASTRLDLGKIAWVHGYIEPTL